MDLLDCTTEFMRLAGQNVKGGDFDRFDVTQLRQDLLQEEVVEYFDAELVDDLVGTVDGLLDIIVIAWGTLLSYVGEGRAKAAAAEVARSNLDKVRGEIKRRLDGKILKPEGWEPPDIAGVLEGLA